MSKSLCSSIFAFGIVILIGCSSYGDEGQLRKMLSMKIVIDTTKMIHLQASTAENAQTKCNYKYTLIRYINAGFCPTCELKNEVIYINDTILSNHPVKQEVIVNANRDDLSKVRRLMRHSVLYAEVYIDTSGVFARMNPHIPNKGMFHTFMIDRNDSVVLVGDPARNKKVRELMYRIIKADK